MTVLTFALQIVCLNSAFEGDEAIEVARILHDLADRIVSAPHENSWTLRDVNGNKVGSASFEDR